MKINDVKVGEHAVFRKFGDVVKIANVDSARNIVTADILARPGHAYICGAEDLDAIDDAWEVTFNADDRAFLRDLLLAKITSLEEAIGRNTNVIANPRWLDSATLTQHADMLERNRKALATSRRLLEVLQ